MRETSERSGRARVGAAVVFVSLCAVLSGCGRSPGHKPRTRTDDAKVEVEPVAADESRERDESSAIDVPPAAPTPPPQQLAADDTRIRLDGERIVVSTGGYECVLSASDGAIQSLGKAQGKSILSSGAHGLWHARFRDGTEVTSAELGESFEHEIVPNTGRVRMKYSGARLSVDVTLAAAAGEISFSAEVRPSQDTLLDFSLPARLRFSPDGLERFVCPMNGNYSTGAAFTSDFFRKQGVDHPSGWNREEFGPEGYRRIYGGPLDQKPEGGAPALLRATSETAAWLGDALASRLSPEARTRATVNRPPTRAQADIVLVDSDDGPWLSACRLGGKGGIWRIGGLVSNVEAPLALDTVTAVVSKLAADNAHGRAKIGLVSLERGPARGGWTSIATDDWQGRMRAVTAVARGDVEFVALDSPAAMMEALDGDGYIAVLNPYGEWTPVSEGKGMTDVVDAIGAYVRAGGHWFEIGGHPFYYGMRPVLYYRYDVTYPPAFSDYFHLDALGASASLYGVQQLAHEPWAGTRDRDAIFVPGRLACGADERGGWCERAWGTFVEAGDTWSAPVSRVTFGGTAAENLRVYSRANRIDRPLADKMKPEILERFRSSVLVYYAGSCASKIANLHLLPVPTQVHFADYLKGGFDKEYPDHLPPSAAFGTPDEFRALFARCRELGHLVVPYTNPTWWCDHPRGPTFLREGDGALLKKLDGTPAYERYTDNDGWTTTLWHSTVRAANRATRRQFTEEYPVDILFQDQCGARGWLYDMNPASPTPYAYAEGMLSMVAEDARTVPLSTESGWDRVANFESQLCGMTWGHVPTRHAPEWRRFMKDDYDPATWKLFPVAQYVAHDKVAMIHHDLGQFVTDREVLAWTIGLGYAMSFRASAEGLKNDETRQWLLWLDRIQKSVCAKYVGVPLDSFEHARPEQAAFAESGLIRARYGTLEVTANLDDRPTREGAHAIAGHGFLALSQHMAAGELASEGEAGASFVVESGNRKTDVWVYARSGEDIAVALPGSVHGEQVVTFDGGETARVRVNDSAILLRAPDREEKKRVAPPEELANTPPRAWRGMRPTVGVIDLGPGVSPSWTSIGPRDWVSAFERSRLAREMGVAVERISTAEQLLAALDAGPARWLAIVNPYGETFPAASAAEWRAMLSKIKDYVAHGGSWWETAGYSFYQATSQEGGTWQYEQIASDGAAFMGLRIGGGEVNAPPSPLELTADGRRWVGSSVADRVAKLSTPVNRGLPRSDRGERNPDVTLVAAAGSGDGFIGGYRLDGWGWLWRIGGFRPNPDVVLPVAIAATEYSFTHPPEPVRASGPRYLVHAVMTPVGEK